MRILLAPRALAATLSVAAALISPQCLPHCARSRPVAGAGGARAPAQKGAMVRPDALHIGLLLIIVALLARLAQLGW